MNSRMDSSTNVYSSEPALPVLATDLLRRRVVANEADNNATHHNRGTLPLRWQFTAGIGRRDDATRLVRTGTTIGLSYVREPNPSSRGTYYSYTMAGHEPGLEKMGEVSNKLNHRWSSDGAQHSSADAAVRMNYLLPGPS